jgi:hypothetical protein
VILAGLAGMSGCAGAKLLSPQAPQQDLRLSTIDLAEPGEAADKIEVSDLKPAAAPAAAPHVTPAADVPQPPAADELSQSAWCRYLREDSLAESTLLESPTVTGSLDDKGATHVGVGYSLAALEKARLIQQEADIKCRKHLAEFGIQKLLFISPAGLTASGFRGKYLTIEKRRGDIAALQRKIEEELQLGHLDNERAAGLQVRLKEIVADAGVAKSQWQRRLAADFGKTKSAHELGADLIQAEQDLDQVHSRMRSIDSTDLSLHGSWNDGNIEDGLDTSHGFSGGVRFSMKLGVLAPQRFEHERLASEAKTEAIRDEEGGALWQLDLMRKAHERAIAGLEASVADLDRAIGDTNKFLAGFDGIENPEFSGQVLDAMVQLIKLEGDRTAAAESIGEIRKNLRALGQS